MSHYYAAVGLHSNQSVVGGSMKRTGPFPRAIQGFERLRR
jgi:hypothetical protein